MPLFLYESNTSSALSSPESWSTPRGSIGGLGCGIPRNRYVSRAGGLVYTDSLYVTVQTVTTVGFGDLTPRTPFGRAFAVVFMLVSVGTVLYALTTTVQAIVHSELFESYGRSRKMSKMRDHFIIWCGPGGVASIAQPSRRKW